ncbi:MAG: response regulator [Leptolyngbya sp.]|nr:response regulator [Candidatus Melainabacteria bacterium]
MFDGIILVVEDDPTLQMVTKMVITRFGYNCEVVGSGEAAVSRDAADVALIFMDVGLPGIQGGHATMMIREKELTERRKRVPIVGLTGHAIREQCLQAGMDDYLQKPVLMEDIKRMLDKWLSLPKAG